jgi:hypothetical protein
VKIVAWIAAATVAFLIAMVVSLSAAVGGQGPSLMPTTVTGIPPVYLQLYVAAAQKEGLDWAILAAIGSIETDHGRSKSQGVHSGVNANGCCAGPMQFSLETWKSYGNGGDIYDPVDAIPAAARYLRAGGAPKDYHAAILAYNHAEWYYRKVMAKAQDYRVSAMVPTSGQSQSGPIDGSWLMIVPGTDQQCDVRIVPNVVALLAHHLTLRACYAPTGHEPSGEHPLGLAVDVVPTPPTTWEALGQIARSAGWRESCASSGCAGQTHTAFRFVGWNGYPGHGDPAHAGTNAHLHLSWNHGPGRPAKWVSLVSSG